VSNTEGVWQYGNQTPVTITSGAAGGGDGWITSPHWNFLLVMF